MISGQMRTFNFDDLLIWLIGYLLTPYITLLNTSKKLINKK